MSRDLGIRADFDPPQSAARGLRAIVELDLEPQRRAAEKHGLSGHRLERAERAFRQFLALPVLFPDEGERYVPTIEVDALWHELILETRKYVAFCQAAYGEFLHHVPKDRREAPESDRPPFSVTLVRLNEAFEGIDAEVWTPSRACNTCLMFSGEELRD